MSHNVEKNNDMIYANYQQPWHGLGIPIEGLFTSKDALQKADLDFEVVKKPVYRQIVDITGDLKVEFQEIPDQYETVRTDTDKHLGIVGNYYTPFQNRDAFAFIDNLVGEDKAIYDTAGALYGGRKVWMLAKLPGDIIVGGKDQVEKFLLFTNGHDGSSPIIVLMTPVRVVCWNTLTAAIKGATNVFKVRHTTNAQERLAEATKLLGVSMEYYDNIEKVYGEMAGFKLTPKTLDKYYKVVMPDPPKKQDKDGNDILNNARAEGVRDELVELFETSPSIKGTNAEGNLWGAFNAVTEYIQYNKPMALSRFKEYEADRKFELNMMDKDSGMYTMRQRALDGAISLINN